jgi:Ras-related protein Rab-8A
VTTEQGQEAANELGVKYIETSAKDDTNVQELFAEMANSIMSLVDQKKTIAVVPD